MRFIPRASFMKKSVQRAIILGLVSICFGAIYYFDLIQYISLEWIKTHHAYLCRMVHEQYLKSVLTYIAFYILATACALPGTFILTMLGGYLFNVVPGIIYINIGATLGATGAFLASRYVIGDWVQRKYHKQLISINNYIKEHGIFCFILLRLILVLPFFIVNLLSGLTSVSLFTFMWTTSVGILPSTLIFSYMGRQLMHINSVRDLLTWPIILAFTVLTLLFLIPLLFKQFKK